MNFEGEVLLQVLDDHDEKGELDSEGALRVGGAGDEGGGDVGAHDFEDGGLDVLVGDALDVAIADLLVPDLEGLGAVGGEGGGEGGCVSWGVEEEKGDDWGWGGGERGLLRAL